MKPTTALRHFLYIATSAVLTATSAHAAILYYDGGTIDIVGNGNSAASGITGNWNTGLLNWDAGPVPYVGWNNTNNDIAFFNAGTAFAAPTPGTVTLTSAITVGGLVFNTSGYTISGNTLTFGATNNTVALNNLVTAATINSAIGTSAANMTFTAQNPVSAATTTFGSAGGWTGTTTVNPGFTLQLNGASTALLNTSGITLNGGTINQNYNAVGDRINDAAAITSNGGTLSTLNPNSAIVATETIGAVTLTRGLTTFVHSASQASLTSQTLTLTSLTRTGSTNTSTVNFASVGGLNTTKNIIVLTGATATPAGQIVGPWATVGNTGGAFDYAVYNASSQIVQASITPSAESTWTIAANAFAMNAGAAVNSASAGLTATRTITALRNTSVVTPVTADSLTDEITLAAHAYANGDALIFGGTVPGGLTAGTLYYVRDVAVGVFKVAATSGGAAIDLSSNGTSVTTTGALTLNASANLETYGLLNGSANTLNVVPGTGGSLTTPSGGGQLHLNAGNGTSGGTMTISAPVTNNSGTVSVVKSGLGTLNLTGTNSFTGGIVVNSGSVVVTPSAANGFVIGAAGADIINGGNLTYSSANAWGVTGRDATVNGTGTLTSSVAYTGGTLTVNSGANAVIANTGNFAYATTTGSGAIIHTPGSASSLLNLGNASGFTGNLQNRGSTVGGAGGTNTGIQFSSLGDGGALQFVGGNTDGNQAATFTYIGTSALSFGTRQIQILERVGGNNDYRDHILANNSADAAHTWTINTGLLATGGRAGAFNATGTAFLILSGTNTGNNAFNGVISDGQYGQGANGNIGLTKTGTGASSKWILGGNNTYSGPTAVSVGILNIQTANALGSTVSGTTVANAARLELQGGITTTAEPLTLTPGTGGSAMLLNVNGNNIWAGSITSNTATNTNVSRIQSDLDKLTITGAVSLTGSAHQLVLQGAGDIEISGQVSGVGRVSSSVTGSGIRMLSGNNIHIGDTLVNGSTLRLGNVNALGFGGLQTTSTGSTTVSAGAVLDLNGSATVNEPITISGTGISSAGALINNTGTAIIGSGIAGITIPTASTGTGYSAAPTITISGTGTGATATATLGVTAATFGTVTVVGTYTAPPTVAISGGGGSGATATVTNAGVLTITNSGTGYTSAPTITFTGGTGGTSMSAIANATSFTVTGVNMTAAGSGYTGTPTYTFTGDATPGSLTLSKFVLAADSSVGGSGNTTINAVVSESGGTRLLTKVGAGTLTLSASNTYTGATAINAGTLVITGTNQATNAITFGGGVLGLNTASSVAAAGATVDFTGQAVLVTGSTGAPSYTLLSASSITGTPTLSTPVPGYALQVVSNELRLVQTGGPGPLDNFLISAISSPQTVGSPITGITLTARDASNATVNFTGTVNFGGTGGFSGTSATFTAGVLSGVSVIPTNAGSGLTFTVTDIGSGKTGSATITTIQTQYAAWSGGAVFGADANGDGVNNGMAFLLGAASPSANAIGLLPVVTQSGGNLVLTFSVRNAAARGASVLNVQHSSDLGITDLWTGTAVPDVTTGVANGVSFAVVPGTPLNSVVATIQASNAASGKLFGRLKADQ